MDKRLNINYSAIFGTYWMHFGVLCSFASVFLLSRGFSNSRIGIILAVANLLSVVIQPLLGDIADRGGKLAVFYVIHGLQFVIGVVSVFLLFYKGAGTILTIMYTLGYTAVVTTQPFINSLCRKFEERGAYMNFGICRSMGSLSYATLTFFLGGIVAKKGEDILPVIGIIILLAFTLIVFLTLKSYNKMPEPAVVSPGSKDKKAEATITLSQFAKRHKLFIVMGIGILGVFFANSSFNSFAAQIALNVGGTNKDIGRLLAVMAFCEIPTMAMSDKLQRKFGSLKLIRFSALAFFLWMVSITLSKNVYMLMASQLFQPFAFAIFLPSMIRFIDENMEKGEAVKGQTVFITIVTIGSIFSGLIGGKILDTQGATFLTGVGSITALLGALIIVYLIPKVAKEC